MRVVIDTNCFLSIIPKVSPYRPVFDAYRRGKFELAVTTEILHEYEEIFSLKMTDEIANNLLELIDRRPNTVPTEVYYRWQLIHRDPDDNRTADRKFVDAAIAANADYVVTNDGHFSDLDLVSFPPVQRITLQSFLEIVLLISS